MDSLLFNAEIRRPHVTKPGDEFFDLQNYPGFSLFASTKMSKLQSMDAYPVPETAVLAAQHEKPGESAQRGTIQGAKSYSRGTILRISAWRACKPSRCGVASCNYRSGNAEALPRAKKTERVTASRRNVETLSVRPRFRSSRGPSPCPPVRFFAWPASHDGAGQLLRAR